MIDHDTLNEIIQNATDDRDGRMTPAMLLLRLQDKGFHIWQLPGENVAALLDELWVTAARRNPDHEEARSVRAKLNAEYGRMQAWVNDLLAGTYVNCVFCGHCYGPNTNTPVSQADVLKAHIAVCPEHPMAKLLTTIHDIRDKVHAHNRGGELYAGLRDVIRDTCDAAIKAAEGQS